MPRLEFDPVTNGSNLRKHGTSLDQFGDMDLAAALVAEDATQSTAAETRYVGQYKTGRKAAKKR